MLTPPFLRDDVTLTIIFAALSLMPSARHAAASRHATWLRLRATLQRYFDGALCHAVTPVLLLLIDGDAAAAATR